MEGAILLGGESMDVSYKDIKDNADDRKDLTDRQDADVLLRNLDAYVMMGLDGKTAVSKVINVTLNRPKVMSAFIIAALGNTSEQILVESEEKDFDPDYIKDFRRLLFAAANARLLKQGGAEINPYLDEQSCIRGGASLLVVMQMEKGRGGGLYLDTNITKWDHRYTNFVQGGVDGLLWAANGYGAKEKRADVENQRWWEHRVGIDTFPGKEAEVVDLWTAEGHIIYLAGQKVFEEPHKFQWADGTPYVPVVIQGVPVGSSLSDKDDLKHQNESIFFLIREAMPEMQRLISIVQTQAFNTLKPPIMVETVEGHTIEVNDLPLYEALMAAGAISNANAKIITQADANRAAMMAMERMDVNMREAGFIPRQLDPPQSGIALIIEKEGQDIIQLPRLRLKGTMKTSVGDMATAQIIQIGGSVEIGTVGHKRTFDTGKLAGQYEVTHKFRVKSLANDAGLASLAASYGDDISAHTKRRDIYQLDDPDGEENWLAYEEAERLSPLVKLRRVAKHLLELGKDEEAVLITDEAGVVLEQLLAGKAATPGPEKPKEATQMMSLFGGQTNRRPAPPQEEVR